MFKVSVVGLNGELEEALDASAMDDDRDEVKTTPAKKMKSGGRSKCLEGTTRSQALNISPVHA